MDFLLQFLWCLNPKKRIVGRWREETSRHTHTYIFSFRSICAWECFLSFSLSFSLVVQVKFGNEDVKFDWIYVKLGLPSYKFWPLHTGLPSVFKTTKQSSRRRLNWSCWLLLFFIIHHSHRSSCFNPVFLFRLLRFFFHTYFIIFVVCSETGGGKKCGNLKAEWIYFHFFVWFKLGQNKTKN